MIEKLTFKNLGKHQDDWAVVYLDPNNTYSKCGGRITVILGDYVGSAFFSHCGTETFKQFIAKTHSHYLIGKLFNQNNEIEDSVFIEDGAEILELIYRDKKDEIKQARAEGKESLSRDALRSLYNALYEEQFHTTDELYRHLDSDEQATMECLFGEEWIYGDALKKDNPKYLYVESMVSSIIAEFKKLSEVSA
ncbi:MULTISPECIES: hypothetical protein [Acinetobacter calcoaceticus/baumannii complex]|uniref:hypothetical protein n=1 Tax=Acinetobacter calcoaceticus/baumannii complex TaxID=909768 RepID=UPI0003025D01|nr:MULTISPECIES: hypothetical protein [Acinetobacter calcoaceticus/baumannii complex]WFQ22486.1 hypothetical protein P9J63_05775 [Acinetobacter baumannii]WFQ26103.1 hypothetical protein P9J61_05760 [Acinetobacter baumannii]WFQ29754.1 hypothetical protein P9J59_05765 [Acinetobacter baumannii]SSP30586.1 Uncharacterised protein [Acinetobacter pittii]